MAVEFLTLAIVAHVKGNSRRNNIEPTKTAVDQGVLTPQQGLLKLLDTFIGATDTMSFKYTLFLSVFDIEANNASLAEKMIKYTISQLKAFSDTEVPLQVLPNINSN